MNPDFRFNLLQLAGSPIFDGTNEERIALAGRFEEFCTSGSVNEADASNEKAEVSEPDADEGCSDPTCIVCSVIRPALERAAAELDKEATAEAASDIPPEVMKIIETMQAAGYKVAIGELR